jgi:hypothetical protein
MHGMEIHMLDLLYTGIAQGEIVDEGLHRVPQARIVRCLVEDGSADDESLLVQKQRDAAADVSAPASGLSLKASPA